MSLIKETSLCVRLVARLQSLTAPSSSIITSFLSDASRFVLRFVPILAEAPLQIYSSGLLFSPEASIVRTMFIRQVPQTVEVLSGRDIEWDACRSVLEGHSDEVNTVVFSPDGQLVASASYDRTVRVWETATGQCRSVLEGHSDLVNTVVFSPDGQLVASASYDRTVRVWETATGQCRSVLEGHSDEVSAVVFSPDGQLVASASKDRTVRVWETATGQCCSVLPGRTSIPDIAFSPDGQRLQTNKDDIVLPSGLTTVSSIQHTEELSSVMVENEWIVRQKRRFLWLPPEYRYCETAVHKHIVCLGCSSGRVTLLSLQ
ncbi:WD40 repeat-like protein [Bimuria novae-zelandiae CBS 107.79]|uniref:WD40 repeat-like protein n=1 Tax=Bimuria novae-zelandiae CBS 107.79 TaxID=1447943 RepID=A0A6A5USI1_9PLEO|nr:WD40 repeat-like protein [Bimuria novae-zelandiae CBS 107.79]